ncbi:MAG: ATP-binding protein [Nitrospirota bacterium]
MKIVDPVCGMTIEEKAVFGTSSYKGTIYYFCSKECKENFDKDPAALLIMKAEREKLVEEERSKTLEQMMDEVTHEIRNPLTSIGGFVRKVHGMLPEGDPKRGYLEMVIEDVMRLENMIKQLVDLKTMGVTHMKSANINDIITDVLKTFAKEFKENNIEVKTELMIDPPPTSVDKEKITIALANLIKNAIEAMQKPSKVITITNHLTDEYMEIMISDTGRGIPKDKIKYIFDPFFTSKIYGPGLGLTFTQKIIQEHRGTISVKSEIGEGTTFIIRLPL